MFQAFAVMFNHFWFPASVILSCSLYASENPGATQSKVFLYSEYFFLFSGGVFLSWTDFGHTTCVCAEKQKKSAVDAGPLGKDIFCWVRISGEQSLQP